MYCVQDSALVMDLLNHFVIHVGDLSVRREDSSWPSYQALAFDIECLGEEGFPTATNEADLILQISCVLWSTGEEAGRYRRILLTLGEALARIMGSPSSGRQGRRGGSCTSQR